MTVFNMFSTSFSMATRTLAVAAVSNPISQAWADPVFSGCHTSSAAVLVVLGAGGLAAHCAWRNRVRFFGQQPVKSLPPISRPESKSVTPAFAAVKAILPASTIMQMLQMVPSTDLGAIEAEVTHLSEQVFFINLTDSEKRICLDSYLALVKAKAAYSDGAKKLKNWPVPNDFSEVIDGILGDISSGKIGFLHVASNEDRNRESGSLARAAFRRKGDKKEIVVYGSVEGIDPYLFVHEFIHYAQDKLGRRSLFVPQTEGDLFPHETDAYFTSAILSVYEQGTKSAYEQADSDEEGIRRFLKITTTERDDFLQQTATISDDLSPRLVCLAQITYMVRAELDTLAASASEFPIAAALRATAAVLDDSSSATDLTEHYARIYRAVTETYLANKAIRGFEILNAKNQLIEAEAARRGISGRGTSEQRIAFCIQTFHEMASSVRTAGLDRIENLVMYWILTANITALLRGSRQEAMGIIEKELLPEIKRRITAAIPATGES